MTQNTMFIIALVAVTLLGMSASGLVVYIYVKSQTIWQAERKDLLDRLMARDLPEVKQAQAMENRAGANKPTSKRQNDARLIKAAEMAEKE